MMTTLAAVLLLSLDAESQQRKGTQRHYYLAAEDVEWDYAPSTLNLLHGSPVPRPWAASTRWQKTRYIEYTDESYSQRKPQPVWLGILGPVLRGEVGDEILVHLLNRSKRAQSIHTHGVRYDKASEGAHYAFAGEGASVPSGARFTYRWLVTEESGPGRDAPGSRVWLYHGHVNEPFDTNAGLIGPLIITAAGNAKPDASPKDVDREFVTLFMIFDELQGQEAGLFHTINGLVFGNLQGLVMNDGERVRWYLMTLGNEQDMHTPHWHGEVARNGTGTRDVVALLPGVTETLDMVADNPGSWMYQCHVSDHMEAGMMSYFTILPKRRACPIEPQAGEFWDPKRPFSFAVKNVSSKVIEAATIETDVINGPYHLRKIYPDWKGRLPIRPGQSEKRSSTMSIHNPSQILGWVLYPTDVRFSDGSTWSTRYRGECAQVFWRDPALRFDLTVLPPLETEHEEEE